MSISLKALEAAVTKVEQIRDDELTFEAGDSVITLRGLRPDEDTSVQRYANEVLPKDGTSADQTTLADFMDRMRFGILGYSVVQIDDLDLRNVEYLDAEDEDGTYQVPKHEGLRELIKKSWSRAMMSVVFKKFTELLDKIEIRAEKAVHFDPEDLDDEISRIEARLAELKESKTKREEDVRDNIRNTQKAVSSINSSQEQARNIAQKAKDPTPDRTPEPPVPSEEVAPPRPPTEGAQRRPSIPQSAPPPQRPDPVAEQPEPPVEPNRPVHPPTPDHRGPIPDPYGGDSFMDTSDPEEAIYAEGLRQEMLFKKQQEAAAREKERNQQLQNEQSKRIVQARANRPTAAPAKSVDVSSFGGRASQGLRQALNTQDAVVQQTSEPPVHSASSQRPAQIDGHPVFAMGTQVLDKKQSQDTQEVPPVPIDAPGGFSSRNPRFRGGSGDGSGML